MDLSAPDRVTPWQKRTLALQLSHIFLHTHDCGWTTDRWKASDVQFAESRHGNAVESPPYITCNNKFMDVYKRESSAFVALAKLLVEVEIGVEIKGELIQYNKLGEPDMVLTISMILDEGRMSNTRYYSEAVEQCLRLAKGREDPESLRNYILDKVVKNLEIELALMRKPQGRTPFPSDTKAMNATHGAPPARDFVSDPTNTRQDYETSNLGPATMKYSAQHASIVQSVAPRHNILVPQVRDTRSSISKQHRNAHSAGRHATSSGVPNRKKQKPAKQRRLSHVQGSEDATDHGYYSNIHETSDATLRLFEDHDAHISNEP